MRCKQCHAARLGPGTFMCKQCHADNAAVIDRALPVLARVRDRFDALPVHKQLWIATAVNRDGGANAGALVTSVERDYR
jgi:hypothetical protein